MKSFIVPLLIILLSNATSVLIFKKKFSKVIVLTLLFLSFPMFLSGILFSTFKIGIIINILYSFSSIVVLFFNRKNKENIENFKNNYFSLGLIAFITLYVLIFIYDFNRTFTAWDEKSHWGVMLKEMFRLDKLYTVKESTLMVHKDYPPMLQLFELFWIYLCGSFKEAFAIRALHILELSLFVSFVKDDIITKKNIITTIFKTILISLIVLSIILLFDCHGVMNSIYNDYFLALLVCYSLIFIYKEKDLTSFASLLNLSIVFVFMLLTKQVSISFYLMILFFYVLVLLNSKKNLNIKKYLKIITLLLVIPMLFYKIWGVYISSFVLDKQFEISDIKIGEFLNIIFDSSNEKHKIVRMYISAIINKKISFLNIFELSYLKSFFLFTVLFIIISFNKLFDKNKLYKYYITILIGAVGYLVLMLVLYIFCFAGEGYTLASFDRYMDTYLLIEYGSLFILMIINIEEKGNNKQYCLLLLILILITEHYKLNMLKPIIKKPHITNEERVSNTIMKKTNSNDKIFLLSQDTEGIYQFSVKYYANPRITNLIYYELPVEGVNYYEFFYNDVNDYLLKFDYLYIVNTNDIINEKYDFIFKNIKNDELYKIINNKGKVELELAE